MDIGGQIVSYFNDIALERVSYRKKRSYYWNSITKYCNYFSHPDFSVLEIGCGTGELIHEISGKRKTGIDFSGAMISQARKQFNDVDFYEMCAEEITLNEKFDLVILSNVIGTLDDIYKVFVNLHKVCHESTKIIITYYNHLWEPVICFSELIGIKKKAPVQNWLSSKDIVNLLQLAGFEVYKNNTRLLLPVYIPVLSGIFNTFLDKLPLFKHLCLNKFICSRPIITSSNEQKYSVSVIVPARNESGNIVDIINNVPIMGAGTELIFVEGNSTDDTWQKIKDVTAAYSGPLSVRIMQQEGKGKGDAVRKGFSNATGDILMIMDADLTVPPEMLPRFYEIISSGKSDFVMGSRLVYPLEKEAMRFLNMLGNKFFGMVFSWLLEQPIKDTLCGTKVLFKKDYQYIEKNRSFFGEFDPFGDYDLIFGAYKLNLKITEIPIRYQARTYGTTNISRFKHGLILLRMCVFASKKIKFY